MKFLVSLILFWSAYSYAQSDYYKLDIKMEYTHNDEPIVDSLMINSNLKSYISTELPDLYGKKIRIRSVLDNCDGIERFRVYDCNVLEERTNLLMEEISLSRWLSDKIIIIYFNESIDPSYLEQKIKYYDFFIEW